MRSARLLTAGYVLVLVLGIANIALNAEDEVICPADCGQGDEVTQYSSAGCPKEGGTCYIVECNWGSYQCYSGCCPVTWMHVTNCSSFGECNPIEGK